MTVMMQSTVQASVDDFFNVVEELAGELREWYDNMPQNMQGGSKGQEVEQAASALEALERPEVPDEISDLPLMYDPYRPKNPKRPSRNDRLHEQLASLSVAIDVVDSWLAGQDVDDPGHDEDLTSAVGEFYDAVRDAMEIAENVEFPRMM